MFLAWGGVGGSAGAGSRHDVVPQVLDLWILLACWTEWGDAGLNGFPRILAYRWSKCALGDNDDDDDDEVVGRWIGGSVGQSVSQSIVGWVFLERLYIITSLNCGRTLLLKKLETYK